MITCPNCGKDVSEDAVHCGHCGHRLQPKQQNKTMLGMGAIDPEWQQKFQEAKAASEKEEVEDESAYAATAAMEAVAFEQEEPAGEDDSAFAATAALEAVRLPEKTSGGAELDASELEATSQMEPFRGEGAGIAAATVESAGAEEATELDLGAVHLFDQEAATAPHEPVKATALSDQGDEWQIGKLDSQVEADLAGDTFPPTVEEEREPSLGEASASSASSEGMGEGAMPSWDPGEEAGGNRSRLLLFVGVVGALFFFCCASSAAGYFFFGEALAEFASVLEP